MWQCLLKLSLAYSTAQVLVLSPSVSDLYLLKCFLAPKHLSFLAHNEFLSNPNAWFLYSNEQALNCGPRHVVRILLSRRGCEQSNLEDGTLWSLASLHLELKALSGDVVKAGLGWDQHQVGAVAFDEIILKAESPGVSQLSWEKQTNAAETGNVRLLFGQLALRLQN